MAIGAAPLKLEVWVPQEELVQGEPLVLHYRITNLSQEDWLVELWGPNRFPVWLAGSTLQSPGREPVSLAPGMAPVDYGGGIDMPGFRSQAVQPWEGREVISRWTPPLAPGRVDLHLVMQVAAEGLGAASGSTAVLKAQEIIRLVVTERDAARLQALSQSLLQTLRMGPEVAEEADLDLLLALPAEDAEEAWRSLAGDPALDSSLQYSLVKSLGQHDSGVAADILAGLAWDTAAEPQSPAAYAARQARDNLLNLYRRASPVVQERARQLFLAHEGAAPL